MSDFSVINSNNVIVAIYKDTTYEKVRHHSNVKPNWIVIPKEEYHVKGLNLNTYKPVSNKEKIANGEITLASNQVYDAENDYIITLMPDQEYRNGEIVTLNYLEQYQKGVLTEEEYLAKTDASRQLAYQDTTDKQVIELMRSYLNSNIKKLTDEEKAMLEKINSEVAGIKEANPK